MAIQREHWISDIQEKLLKSNLFINHSTDDSAYVHGKSVHVPNAGTPQAITVDLSSFPATATERTDTDIEYTIHSFSARPARVRILEDDVLEYAKRQSVMGASYNAVVEKISDYMPYYWSVGLPTANLVSATGPTGSTLSYSWQTGTRKTILFEDIKSAALVLNKANVPQDGRIILCDPTQLNQIMSLDEFTGSEKITNQIAIEGSMGKIFGLNVIVRSQVLWVSGTTVQAPTVTGVTTDALALVYHPSFVRKAIGAINVYSSDNDPLAYGDIMSFDVLAGGSPSYSTFLGIVGIRNVV